MSVKENTDEILDAADKMLDIIGKLGNGYRASLALLVAHVTMARVSLKEGCSVDDMLAQYVLSFKDAWNDPGLSGKKDHLQ